MRVLKAFLRSASIAVLLAALAACGGGGGDSDAALQSSAAAVAPNVLPVTVKLGPSTRPNVNIPYVSVTVCAPGGANCRTIDNVVLDTGSTGLRLFASALPPALALPPQTAANGVPYGECMQFADLTTLWGPVKLADVKLSGKTAAGIPIQVIADPSFAAIPAACANAGKSISDADKFGASGVLGIGLFAQDCGARCAQPDNGLYYACGSSCAPAAIASGLRVQNPVSRFESDNNGVVLTMPAVPAAGAATASGKLVFGIGTRDNNALGAATVLRTDAFGYISTTYRNRLYQNSFIDSGSNAIFFPDDQSIPVCNDFYCPASTQTQTATNASTIDGMIAAAVFDIANATQMFSANPRFTAFSNLAGTFDSGFDWGLPFFYGRSVFTAIDGMDTPGGRGPYYAY